MKDIEVRKQQFKLKIWDYVQSKGKENYQLNTLKNFFSYWTEHNEPVRANTKMRFEAERFFSIGRRLATWINNEEKFNNGKSKSRLTEDQQRYLASRTDI